MDDRATAAIQEFDEAQNKKDKPPKGVVRFVVPVDPATGEVYEYGGLERERLYAQMAAPATEKLLDIDGTELDVDRVRPPGGYNPADYG